MKKLIILLTLVSFIQSLDLLAKEQSEHREKKSQRDSHQVKPSKAQSRQQRQATVRTKERAFDGQNKKKPTKRDKKYNRTNKHTDRHIVDRTNSKHYASVRKHDTHRYTKKNHRKFVNKQKHRRHNTVYRNQHRRYNYDHYRGSHQHGKWHAGHGHHHYDYRYRYTYNPYQWYDDYYYQSYFDWRWGRASFGSYSHDYYDPYYCPDGFTEFVAGLTVGALIYNW